MANTMRRAAASRALENPKKSGGNRTFNTPSPDTAYKASDPTKHVGGSAAPAPADARVPGRPFGIVRPNLPGVRMAGQAPNKPGGAPAAAAPTSVKAPPPGTAADSAKAKAALKGAPPEAKPPFIGEAIGGDRWARAGQSARAKIAAR